jgi:pentatricopeptide repeat protein
MFSTVGNEAGTAGAAAPAAASRDDDAASLDRDIHGQRLLQAVMSEALSTEGGSHHLYNYSTLHSALEECLQTSNPGLSLKVLEAMNRHPQGSPTESDFGIAVSTIGRSSDASFLPEAVKLVVADARVPIEACSDLLRRLRTDWKAAIRILRAVESRSNLLTKSGPPRQEGTDSNLAHMYQLVIEACALSSQAEPASQVLRSCLERGLDPTPASYELVVSAFARRLQWRRALQLLDQMEGSGVRPTLAIFNSILAAMSKAREAGPALALLGRLRQRHYPAIRPDIYSFNHALAAAAGDPRYWKEALQVFDQCQREPGVTPDVYTYSNAIRACAKGGQTQRALALLEAAKDLRLPVDGYCYTATMEACSKAKMWERALDLLKEMQVEYQLKPTAVAFSLCISACGNAGRWQAALDLLQQMRDEGLRINLITYNSAITALSKSASRRNSQAQAKPLWPLVQELLRQVRQNGLVPDGFSYSAAISCCGAEGRWEEALGLIEEMKLSGARPNKVAFSAAISTCGKNGQVEHALRLFREMREERIAPDRVAYNALFSALRVGKRGEEAYVLWCEMLSGQGSKTASSTTNSATRGVVVTPDIITVTEVIASLASDESSKSRALVDEVFRAAFDRAIVLRSQLDSTWDFDLSGMSLPVARAACRFILNRIAKLSDSADLQDLTLITGVGINHARRSAGEHTTDDGTESWNISLRDYIQEVLLIDFRPPLTSQIPPRAQGTLLVPKAVLRHWLQERSSA